MILETESAKDVFMYRMEECSSIRLTGFHGEGRREGGAREMECRLLLNIQYHGEYSKRKS